jgi:hypothetical protein
MRHFYAIHALLYLGLMAAQLWLFERFGVGCPPSPERAERLLFLLERFEAAEQAGGAL